MRSLVISLYILVLGCLLVVSFVVEEWGAQYYKQDISEQYLDYSEQLTPLIVKEMLANPTQFDKTLSFWSKIIEENEDAIQLITVPIQEQSQAYIETMDLNDQADYVHIISPINQKEFNNQALSFTFYDSYSDSFIIQYFCNF